MATIDRLALAILLFFILGLGLAWPALGQPAASGRSPMSAQGAPWQRLEAIPLRFEDQHFRLEGRQRLKSLLTEAEAPAQDPAEQESATAWFAVRKRAMALLRELDSETVTPRRLESIRLELAEVETWRHQIVVGEARSSLELERPLERSATRSVDGSPKAALGDPPPPIVGTVTDASTGEPIEGISVSSASESGSLYQTVLTNADGEYSLPNHPAGNYLLFTGSTNPTSAPHIDEVWDDITCLGGLCDVELEGQPVALQAGSPSPVADFALARGGQIAGELRDATTLDPLPTAYVQFFAADGELLPFTLSPTGGSYETPALPAGQYYVRAYGPLGYLSMVYPDVLCAGSNCDITDGDLVTVTAENISSISFDLPLGARLTGRVTDESTGNPISAQVWVFDEENAFVRAANAAGDGTYSILPLLPGRYFARVLTSIEYFNELWQDLPDNRFNPSSGTPIDVELGEEATGIDFALRRGATISGSLSLAEDGSPITWSPLTVFDANGSHTARTDGAGLFEFGPLEPGNAYVRTDLRIPGLLDEVWDDVHCPFGTGPPTCGTPIPVMGTEAIPGIDLALDPASALRGRITSSEDGAPIAGASVRLVDGPQVESSTDGSYEFPSLAAGGYLVRVSHPDFLGQASGGVPCSPFNCPHDVGETVLIPTATTVEGLDFALDPGGIVTGRVTSAGTGLPLQYVIIWLYDETGLGVAGAITDSGGFYRTDAVPLDGSFYLNTPIVPNGYLKELWLNHRGFFHLPEIPEPDILQGSSFDFTAGAHRVIDFDLDALAIAPELTVEVQTWPGGDGSVVSVDGWIDCGEICSSLYPTGATVTLQAVPAASTEFAGWSGDPDCVDGVLMLTESAHCIALFAVGPIFIDDFETGTLEAWGEVVP